MEFPLKTVRLGLPMPPVKPPLDKAVNNPRLILELVKRLIDSAAIGGGFYGDSAHQSALDELEKAIPKTRAAIQRYHKSNSPKPNQNQKCQKYP